MRLIDYLSEGALKRLAVAFAIGCLVVALLSVGRLLL